MRFSARCGLEAGGPVAAVAARSSFPAMGQRRGVQTKVETPLAERRVARGMSQEEVAEATGISLSTYRRMERGKLGNPPIGYLINCAHVLGCKVFDLVEPRHRKWLS